MTVLSRDAPVESASLLLNSFDGIKLFEASAERVDGVIAFVRCKADVQGVVPGVLSAVLEDGLIWFASKEVVR
jgi:hypothetical protein